MRVVLTSVPVAAQEAACRMNRDQHREAAERLLADPAADTTAVLAAIGHAILAGAKPALHYDAYAPPDSSGCSPNRPDVGTQQKEEPK